jgi:hypothetical protein
MNSFLENSVAVAETTLHAADTLSAAASVSIPSHLKGSTSQEALSQLGRRIDRLSLACQAMWELLRDKAGVTEDELRDKILEVDLRDGSTDGKMASFIVECPHCKARTNSRRPTCIICGLEIPRKHQLEV